jgi:hypothetical protein
VIGRHRAPEGDDRDRYSAVRREVARDVAGFIAAGWPLEDALDLALQPHIVALVAAIKAGATAGMTEATR